MLSGLFYLNSLERSISYIKGVWLVFIISCSVEIFELNPNRVDPDQTPCSAVSDLGPHCLPMSLLLDARLKWVKLLAALLLRCQVAYLFLWSSWMEAI